MSNLSTLPKGDSAWLLRRAIERIIKQVSVLETNIGASTSGNSADTQVIFNDNGTLRGDTGLTYNKTSDVLSFGAGTCYGNLVVGSNVLKVDSANNRVGIGTASPLGPFHLVTTAAGFSDAGYFENSQAAAANVGPRLSLLGVGSVAMATIDAGWNAAANTDSYLRFLTRGTSSVAERYRIASDGVATWSNVGGVAGTAMTLNSTGLGVGASPLVTNPGRGNVTVNGSSDSILVLGIGGSANSYIYNAPTAFNIFTTSKPIVFDNGSERMRIDTSGNVGIGVTPSAWGSGLKALQVGARGYGSFFDFNNDVVGLTSNLFWTGSAYSRISTSSKYAVAYYHDIGTGVHQWLSSSAAGTNGVTPTMNTNMTLDASGNLLVGLTSANASGGVLQLKSGITFPATQVTSTDANTLDDYEEGTWTPNPSAGSFSSASGHYTKVGNLVTANFDVVVGVGGGDVITNLPFQSSVTTAGPVFTTAQDYAAGTTAPIFVVGASGVLGYLRTVGDNVAFSPMVLTAGAGISGSITYRV